MVANAASIAASVELASEGRATRFFKTSVGFFYLSQYVNVIFAYSGKIIKGSNSACRGV